VTYATHALATAVLAACVVTHRVLELAAHICTQLASRPIGDRTAYAKICTYDDVDAGPSRDRSHNCLPIVARLLRLVIPMSDRDAQGHSAI
jgi:hypothetical protein